MMKKWGSILCCVWGLMGCEKTINIQTEQQAAKVVVDAQIEDGQPPLIILSRSINYFSTVDLSMLDSTFIHGAKMTISDGNQTYPLQEITAPINSGYSLYYYSTALLGVQGKKYDLQIETGGQVYQTSTTIPLLTKKIDSLWWKPAPNNPDTMKVVLMARVTDPPGLGNYIRYFTRFKDHEGFLPGYNSVFDDQVIDGKTYDIQVDQGVAKDLKQPGSEYGYFRRGDTVTVKFCNIDKASFDFWRTWEFNFQSIGNPFSSPGIVLGNISNGGLGAFCGYSVQLKRLIIPK